MCVALLVHGQDTGPKKCLFFCLDPGVDRLNSGSLCLLSPIPDSYYKEQGKGHI